jgi:hypothetical protein
MHGFLQAIKDFLPPLASACCAPVARVHRAIAGTRLGSYITLLAVRPGAKDRP